jgi:DNA-binding NarL/FixJ family response regulator
MAQKTTIILTEETELFRKSLVALLNTNPQFDIVAEASNGKELLEQLKTKSADIVILDTDMAILDGKAALEIIHRRFPQVKVIVLSKNSNMQYQSDFIANGASAYLSKNCDVKTLFNAIQKVKSEGYFFDNTTYVAMIDSILREKQKSSDSSVISFNERETEVLRKICDGKTNKEIATSLHLSVSTIDFYRTKIYNKVKCNNVAGLLKYALTNGLIVFS